MRSQCLAGLGVIAALALASACSNVTDPGLAQECVDPSSCKDAGAGGNGDAGGTTPPPGCQASDTCQTDGGKPIPPGRPDDGILNADESDVDCGGTKAPKCAEGKICNVDGDCDGACNYQKRCISIPSCKAHLGGDTCGLGEVGASGAQHESCCKSLPVPGFEDDAHPGKTVYLDKYEITVGRVRAWLDSIAAQYGGEPNVRKWIEENPPLAWDADWNKFLPVDRDGETIIVDRKLIGDPRGTWPGAPPVPPTDEPRKTGTDFQFNGSLFMYLHGNNCSTHDPDGFGFPTFFYPAEVLAKMGPQYPPRADGVDFAGLPLPASEHLEVKSMNCITNAMLQAFCAWDGGQLATDSVMDFVTASPASLGSNPGCGTQVGTENPPKTDAATKGGRCADLNKINATFDAGGALPEPNSPLNVNNYIYPYYPGSPAHDKAWEVAAPGRGTTAAKGDAVDQVRINPGDEPWMDLAGNLSEAVLATKNGAFTGRFGLKFRGIGYQSARSQLNFDPKWDDGNIARIERPQAKAGFAGGRCMRFK